MPEPYLLNGSGGSIDKLGVITAEQTWELDSETLCVSHAPEHDLGIPIAHRQWRNQAHGKWHVTLTFEGVKDVDESDGKEEFEIEGTTSEDPIESHHNITKLTELYPAEEKDGRIVWAKTMEVEGKEARNPLFGYEAYLVAGLIWTRNKLFAELPEDLLDGLSAIEETPPGDPPKLPAPAQDTKGRNWLLIRAIARQRGNIWQVTHSWQLSGPGGWNEDLYARG